MRFRLLVVTTVRLGRHFVATPGCKIERLKSMVTPLVISFQGKCARRYTRISRLQVAYCMYNDLALLLRLGQCT